MRLALLVFSGVVALRGVEFADIVPVGSTPERVAKELRFVEGPTWISSEKCWFFSDIPADRLYRLKDDLTLSVALEPSHQANGNRSDAAGNRYTCEHATRRVSRTAPDGSRTEIATTFGGKAFNSPNDCALAADGALWFTDPDYGLAQRPAEQPCHGVYRLAPGAAEPSLVAHDFVQPNGICFSPDGTICYIADSGAPHHVRAFAVDHGTLTTGRIFTVITPGVPDGMRCDRDGRLYVTAGNGVQIFAPDGNKLGVIPVPETPANCAFGGDDGKTLLITARTSVYRIRLLVAGLP